MPTEQSKGQAEGTVEVVSDEGYHWIEEQKLYLPRVTAITGLYPKGPQFENWLKTNGANADNIRDQAANEGIAFHRAAHRMVMDETLRCYDFAPDLWKKLCAFRDWWQKYDPELLIEPEALIWDDKEVGTAGHPDLVAVLKDIGPAVVDYKAGNYLYTSHELQIEAYARILAERYDQRNLTRCLLHLTPRTKQGYSFRQFEADDRKYDIFHALRAVFHYENGDRGPKAEAVPETLSLADRPPEPAASELSARNGNGSRP